MTSAIVARVFVVGIPRSGTTLLQSLLATHSALASFTESHLFSRHFRALPFGGPTILRRDPTLRLQAFLSENGLDAAEVSELLDQVGWKRLDLGPLAPRTRAAARKLLSVLDQVAMVRGKVGWVEKTPKHLRYVPFLDRILEHSSAVRFVHIIRDGAETASSLFLASRSWERSYDLKTCAERWNRGVAFSLDRVGSSRDRFVFYEDLTRDPESVLRPIIRSLGLEWEQNMVHSYADTARRVVADGEVWKSNVGGALSHSRASLDALSGEQTAEIERLLDHELYERLYREVGLRGEGRSR